ncbi:MAG: glycolate oxidase subunit GlcE [Gammaproteobacteria bacterium]|jgi:glycolate oxidase FAD binding subunit|nr:glycolate oxidase subunit GlcE [Gammaproteobacteria bacterium]
MDEIDAFADSIKKAGSDGSPIQIKGGGTKGFLGYVAAELQVLTTQCYTGVIEYHPTELIVRVRSGTPVDTLNNLLRSEGQMLAFEPPAHDATSTVGGVVSAGLSGSARPYRGAARDHLLGVGMVLHDGAYCEFGGQVMKNVAGYDVSRLVCGAYGTLGLLADLSLKVVPAPELEQTVIRECSSDVARETIKLLSNTVSPLSASCYSEGTLRVRLSGNEQTVMATEKMLEGDRGDNGFWDQLDSQALPAFQNAADVWRLSTNADEPLFGYDFAILDWGFAQRWLFDPKSDPRDGYAGSGHWTRVRCDKDRFEAGAFQPLSALELALHRRLKSTFDPGGIFNPGRMYREVGL